MPVSCTSGRHSQKRRRVRHSLRGFLELLEPRLAPATFIVNSTGDQPAADPTAGAATALGPITLRSAIQAANAHANDNSGPDRIEFNIAGSGLHTIAVFSELPAITDPVVIDGYTQPGANANTRAVGSDATLLIALDSPFGFRNGLTINSGNSTVRGLVFSRFVGGAVMLAEHGGNVLAGNYLGLIASGNGGIGNGFGVYVAKGSDGNTIGGTTPADRNVIVANTMGVRIVASSNNVVEGNYFGLQASGLAPLGGNGQGNIVITSGQAGELTGPATGNTIGGTTAGARNVISASGAGVIFGGDQAALTTGNVVEGNFIGTDANGAGNANFSNNGPGVFFSNGAGSNPDGARFNTVGGTSAAARNIIAGNNDDIVVDSAATDNAIIGNYIGTDVTGSFSMRGATGITVHGARTLILDNLVSGTSGEAGIVIRGGDQALIQGNQIGTNANGTSAIHNNTGIVVAGSKYVTIGGTAAGARNVISGNSQVGISLLDAVRGTQILGNLIGTDIHSTGPLMNAASGIQINFNQVDGGSGDTRIGGADPGSGNTIAFNGNNGIDIRSIQPTTESDGEIDSNVIHSNAGNGIRLQVGDVNNPHYRITRNSIFANGALGIDLGGDGVTANDARGHVGPNNYQNTPALTSITLTPTATKVSGTLKSTPNATFRIEFFASPERDPSGSGEGQTFLGFTIIASDATGNASFNDVTLPPAPDGQTVVTATAADGDGNTSEFSVTQQAIPEVASADLTIAMTAAPDPVARGGTLTYTITVTNNGPDPADQVALTTAVPTATTFLSLTAPPGWTSVTPAVGDIGDVSTTIPHLASGATATFSFVVRVNNDTGGDSAFTAVGSLTSDTSDPDLGNNTTSATASAPPLPTNTDLAIAVSATPKTVLQGQVLTYTITVTNNGLIDAGNNYVAIDTPNHTTFESVSVPSGWSPQSPAVGSTGRVFLNTRTITVGASVVLSVSVRVDPTAPIGSTITGSAVVQSETLDPNYDNNTAEDSSTVGHAYNANVTVGISGDVNPAKVGQEVTYTIGVSNTGTDPATGAAVHVSVPTTTTIVSLGGGSQDASGVNFPLGNLGAGGTRQFQIKLRALVTGTITLTATPTADAAVSVGGPAHVTTPAIAAPPTVPPPSTPPPSDPPPANPDPPTVLSAVRYGFHDQATILVVRFSTEMNSNAASNPAKYEVLVSANGKDRAVKISGVWYDPHTYEATLRVSERIYIYKPWRLIVRGNITDASGTALAGDGVAGHSFITTMSLNNLSGPASQAPGASRIGIGAIPAGPRAAHSQKAPVVHTTPLAKLKPSHRPTPTGKPLHSAIVHSVKAVSKPER